MCLSLHIRLDMQFNQSVDTVLVQVAKQELSPHTISIHIFGIIQNLWDFMTKLLFS